MRTCDRYARITAALFLIFALHGCGSDDSTGSTPRTKEELISHTWRVGTAKIGELTLGGSPGSPPPGFDDLSIEFDQSSYAFTFPGGQCGIPAGVHTISGPWRFESNETQVVLDRSSATVGLTGEFVWDIVELTFGNLKTRYDAPSPLSDCAEVSFEFVWVVQ